MTRHFSLQPATVPETLGCRPVERYSGDRRCARIAQLQATTGHGHACVNAWTESLPLSNRLKTIKHQMYGRAGLDLLGRRFLLAA